MTLTTPTVVTNSSWLQLVIIAFAFSHFWEASRSFVFNRYLFSSTDTEYLLCSDTQVGSRDRYTTPSTFQILFILLNSLLPWVPLGFRFLLCHWDPRKTCKRPHRCVRDSSLLSKLSAFTFLEGNCLSAWFLCQVLRTYSCLVFALLCSRCRGRD